MFSDLLRQLESLSLLILLSSCILKHVCVNVASGNLDVPHNLRKEIMLVSLRRTRLFLKKKQSQTDRAANEAVIHGLELRKPIAIDNLYVSQLDVQKLVHAVKFPC
jgi:hypothetical protein